MIDEEYIRRMRNRVLRNNLINIYNQLCRVNWKCREVESLLRKTLCIDNEIIEEKKYKDIEKDIESICSELSNRVIPHVNNQC